MTTEMSDELRRAWVEVERVRAVLRDVEWAAQEHVYYDGVTAQCCPSCRGIKPGEDRYESRTPYGHLETCKLIAALGPFPTGSEKP